MRRTRTRLATAIEQHIERKGWSQMLAARTLELPQPAISTGVNGNIEKLSIECLIAIQTTDRT